MRSLKPDSEHFAFPDALREASGVSTMLAATYLVWEYPNLRAEEAKAVCANWQAYHERRTRPTR